MLSIKLKLQILSYVFSRNNSAMQILFYKNVHPSQIPYFHISMLHSSEGGKNAHSRSKRGKNSVFQVPENRYEPWLPSWLKVRQIIAFYFVFPKSYIHQLQNWDNNIQVIIRQHQSILNYENLHFINKTNSLTCCKIIYWQISAKKKKITIARSKI